MHLAKKKKGYGARYSDHYSERSYSEHHGKSGRRYSEKGQPNSASSCHCGESSTRSYRWATVTIFPVSSD